MHYALDDFLWNLWHSVIMKQMFERGLLPSKHLRSRDQTLLQITQMRSSKLSHTEVVHAYFLFFLVSIIVYRIYILWSITNRLSGELNSLMEKERHIYPLKNTFCHICLYSIYSSITIYMRDRSLPMIPSQCCRLLLYKETLKRIHLLFDPSANISSLSKYNA